MANSNISDIIDIILRLRKKYSAKRTQRTNQQLKWLLKCIVLSFHNGRVKRWHSHIAEAAIDQLDSGEIQAKLSADLGKCRIKSTQLGKM